MTRTALFHSALALALAFASSAAAQAPDAAQRLAREAVIVDTHIDAPGILVGYWADLGGPVPDREFDYPRAREGGLDVAFMAIYTSAARDEDGSARQLAHQQIDAVEALAARHPDRFALLTSPGDVERLREGGRVLLALGMENGGPIGDDLAELVTAGDALTVAEERVEPGGGREVGQTAVPVQAGLGHRDEGLEVPVGQWRPRELAHPVS